MKVFIFMRFLNFSGAPKMLMWVADRLAQAGHDVTLYTFSYNKDVQPPQNVKYIHDDLDGHNALRKIWQIRKRIRECNADVSVSFLLDANIFNIFACLGLRTKSVVCERSDPYKPNYYKLKFLYPFFSLADGAVFQLKKVQEYYGNIRKHTAVIPNPVTCQSDILLKPFPERQKAIVTLGRLDIEQKRHDILIKAFEIVNQAYPDYQLVIFGRGLDEEKIKNLVTNSSAKNNIKLAGVTLHAQESIKDYQIFVQSSDFEGIPNSLIEAMVIGMPCVATDCSPGGAALLLKNKSNGLLVERGDYHSLAQSIIWMIEHPQEADTMGQKAKDIKDLYSENHIANLWNHYLTTV